MKRIAMFINHEVGGAVTAFYDFMQVFNRHGYKIDLYRFNKAGESFLPLSTLTDQTFDYKLRFHERVHHRLPLIREYVNLYYYWQNLRNLDNASKTMANDIDAKDYDLVFVHVDMMVKIPHLIKYLNTPTYLYLQEPERIFYDPLSLFHDELDKSESNFFVNLQSSWYWPARLLTNKLHKRESDKNIKERLNSKVLVNSYFSADSVFRAYDVMSKVCYLGIDTSWLCMPKRTRENFVLTVGSLTPNKGHAFLVQALSQIPVASRPKFVIVADAATPQRIDGLCELARKKEVEVEIKQNISRAELAELYSTASLFVYGSRLEPFGLAPLEAMAVGTPVVAIRSGGVQETVINGVTGLLVDWDTNQFGQAIEKLITDKELWSSMSQAGPKYVTDKWNWEQTFRRFESLVN